MTAPLKRFRWAFALGGLAALAIMGQLALNQAAVTIASGLGEARTLVTLGKDFWPIWRDDHQFTSGQGDPFWYGRGISNAWPPPHEVAFAPLSYLPWSAAQLVSVALCAALMVFTMLLWSKREGLYRLRSGLWPMLLSAPVFAVVWIDQLQAVAGLAALSLALWAQRTNRSWLVGVAAAFGVIRVANAIPVLVILLLSFWGKPKQLGIALGSAMLAMAPLVAISFLWDPHWVTDYIDGISAYPFNGTAKVASQSLGYPGLGLLALISSAVAIWLIRRDIGGRLDPGRSAMTMAITVLVAPLGGLYCAIFVWPALIRLGLRRGFWMVPWIAAGVPWVVILALSPLLLGRDPGLTLNFISFLDFGLLLLAYPLLRMPPEANASAPVSPMIRRESAA
ncbi:MAG TPA: glycosyltransferase 87 family protein [Candidatus Dormibacteraeota bacterium]